MNHPSRKAAKTKFTRIRCAHTTWQVLEETILFFDQRLGPNDITNRVPIIVPTDDLGGLIEDVRQNKLLYLVKMPMKWNNQERVNTWETHHGKIKGRNMQANGIFYGTVQIPTGLDPYSTQARKGIKNTQGKVWQAQNL